MLGLSKSDTVTDSDLGIGDVGKSMGTAEPGSPVGGTFKTSVSYPTTRIGTVPSAKAIIISPDRRACSAV
jgi:hypothetical protein